MTLEASKRGSCGTDLRGYLGERERVRVFGRWNEVLVRTLRTLCELTCYKKQAVRMMSCSDTPQGMLTPRRVAFAAAEACAEGLPGFAAPVKWLANIQDGWNAVSYRHSL